MTSMAMTLQFGHRFIADELYAAGHKASERRVWRQCSQQRLFSATIRRARQMNKKPGPAVCDDRVERDFTATAQNQLWLRVITEHRTAEGKVYACAVKGVFSNRIVGYSIGPRMKSHLAVAALNDAVTRRRARAPSIATEDLNFVQGNTSQ
jgi:putative transposase